MVLSGKRMPLVPRMQVRTSKNEEIKLRAFYPCAYKMAFWRRVCQKTAFTLLAEQSQRSTLWFEGVSLCVTHLLVRSETGVERQVWRRGSAFFRLHKAPA